MDVTAIRAQFPALASEQGGRPIVFFDNAAGTQVPRRVIDRMVDYLTTSNANSHGVFATSVRSDALIDEARHAAADFLGAAEPAEVAFGANMTTLTQSFARAFGAGLREGDEIVTTRLEHEANVSPWLRLERERGVRVRFADIHEDATIDLESLAAQLTDRTRLVAVGYASNAFGTINPVERVARMAHEAGAVCFVDAVHYGPHGRIDVEALGCDVLACSVYKFFGPHVGVLWGRRALLDSVEAVHLRTVAPVLPDKWETGTLNHEGIAGSLGALEYLESLGEGATRRQRFTSAFAAISAYERELTERALATLAAAPGVRVHGVTGRDRLAERVATFAITVDGYSPREVAEACATAGINVWNGNYYALEPMTRLGLEAHGGAVRVSLVHYNVPAELDRLGEVLASLGRGGA
jgi:cysteine desulfurase family protein (TIGR01976 family)